jgi:hypothetical protein
MAITPLHDVQHEVIQILINELYSQTDKNIISKTDHFIKLNNQKHHSTYTVGGIIHNGRTYTSSAPNSSYLPAYVVHPSLESKFADFIYNCEVHEIHKTYANRILATFFNIKPNMDQISEALGPRLVATLFDALHPEYQKQLKRLWEQFPPSTKFPGFYKEYRDYFKNLQEQVLRNLLLKNQPGETQ